MICASSDDTMKSFEEENWARLSPQFRVAHNRLRMARGKPPIPAPKVDLYRPPREAAIRPVDDPADPEAVAAKCEFRGLDDEAQSDRIAERLALELARYRLADRRLHTEVLHRAIAQFVALAVKERKKSSWNRKKIIGEAMDRYGVGERTVEKAIAKYPKEF